MERGLPASPNATQRDVQLRLVRRCHDYLSRLERAEYSEVVSKLPTWYSDVDAPAREERTNLVPELIDSLVRAGTVDPSTWLPHNVNELCNDPNRFFSGGTEDLCKVREFGAGSRSDYARHIARQVRCGKLRLSTSIRGAGEIFAVGKKWRPPV